MKEIIQFQLVDKEKLLKAFVECFKEDVYYQSLFRKKNIEIALYEMMEEIIDYFLMNGYAYGIKDNDEIVSFMYIFNYHKTKHLHAEIFKKLFSCEDKLYKEKISEIQSSVEGLNANIVYLLSIGVLPDYRRKGIANAMVEHLIQKYPTSFIVSDVSNASSLLLYQNHDFDIRKLHENYYFVKRNPEYYMEEVVLNEEVLVAIPKIKEDLPYDVVTLEGYEIKSKFNDYYFIRKQFSSCEAYLVTMSFQDLLQYQRRINLCLFQEELIYHNDSVFLLYHCLKENENEPLYNDHLSMMMSEKLSEWELLSDIQVMIPIEYETKDLFVVKEYSSLANAFLHNLDYRTHYEAGVPRALKELETSNFKERIKRYYLGRIKVKISDEMNFYEYEEFGEQIGQPAFVDLLLSVDCKSNSGVITIVSLSTPFLISHYMDNIIRNQLAVEYEGKWINLLKFLELKYQIYKSGTPKFLVSLFKEKEEVDEQKIASLLNAETIYEANESLGKFCDQEVMDKVRLAYGMGQYDRALVYAHTNVCIQFVPYLQKTVRGRLNDEAITYFYFELLGFEEASIVKTNKEITRFLSGERTSVKQYLNKTYQIYLEYAKTVDFWDIQVNYPSSKKSLKMLRDSFRIEEERSYLERNKEQMQIIFDTQRDILDRQETSFLNYILLFMTIFQSAAIMFPMFFGGEGLITDTKLLGLSIVSFLFVLCIVVRQWIYRRNRKTKKNR